MSEKFVIKRVLHASVYIIATGLLTAILFPGIYTATAGFLLTGFGVSSVVPLAYALAGKSTTTSAGLAIASVSTVSYIGF
jgi:MFS family permease